MQDTARLADKKLFLLDMDGTIYLGDRVFPGTLPFLSYVRAIGGRAIFLTNNSSRSVGVYLEHLTRLGIPARAEDFFTSAHTTILYMKEHHPDDLFYALGTQSFRRELREAGLRVTDRLEPGIRGLVLGYDTELTYQKLVDASRLLREDVAYIAANPDLVCPTAWGFVPDCGSVAQLLQNAAGKQPRFLGKPEPDIALLAMEKAGFSPAETLLVGDRLYTDIACGLNAGIDTALVLSGETTAEQLAADERRPAFVFDDIAALHRACTAARNGAGREY